MASISWLIDYQVQNGHNSVCVLTFLYCTQDVERNILKPKVSWEGGGVKPKMRQEQSRQNLSPRLPHYPHIFSLVFLGRQTCRNKEKRGSHWCTEEAPAKSELNVHSFEASGRAEGTSTLKAGRRYPVKQSINQSINAWFCHDTSAMLF